MPPLSVAVESNNVVVKVYPSVLLDICDAYVRRNSKQHRVIGTLLGYTVDGVIEVRSCYAVPYLYTAESTDYDIPQHHTMKELHQRVSPREVVVGWFTTGSVSDFVGRDVLIQEFYESECQHPVVLAVDTSLQKEKLGISAFVSRHLGIGDNVQLATEFRPVACEVHPVEVDKVGGGVFLKGDSLSGDSNQLASSISQLQGALEKAHQYVQRVLHGEVAGDLSTGRFLADAVSSVPKIGIQEVERFVADDAQDALLILYLANLVRTQLALADRLGTAALPLL